MGKYKEFLPTNQKRYKASERVSKVDKNQFAKLADVNANKLINCLPDLLKSKDLKELIEITSQAAIAQKPVILGIGGQVIKAGISPLIIDLIHNGVISAIACNGSVVIHDFEISCFGQTSEDVAQSLEDGSFGMASDTCDTINGVIVNAYKEKLGYGEAIGKYLLESNIPNPQLSIARNAYVTNTPLTVHIAIGTDINHQHRSSSGEAIGDCSARDFKIFTNQVSQLGDGGVFICCGSAVILPEVFLKALTVARNNGRPVQDFTTAVFDMNYHYRPSTNIVSRPVQSSGKGYYFVGHHEIMLPLFLLAVREKVLGHNA